MLESKDIQQGTSPEVFMLPAHISAGPHAVETYPPSHLLIAESRRAWARAQPVPETAIYARRPTFGDVMTVALFREYVESGMFIDYDGCGHPMKDGLEAPEVSVSPTAVCLIPLDATHICWYNR